MATHSPSRTLASDNNLASSLLSSSTSPPSSSSTTSDTALSASAKGDGRCNWVRRLVPQSKAEHRVQVAAMFVRDALSVRSIEHRTDLWSVALYGMCVRFDSIPTQQL